MAMPRTGHEGGDGDGVLEADAHRVSGDALGVGDEDVLRVVAEGGAKCLDLGAGAAAVARARAGLVRHVEERACHLAARHAANERGGGCVCMYGVTASVHGRYG
jgi:hypothetical protein